MKRLPILTVSGAALLTVPLCYFLWIGTQNVLALVPAPLSTHVCVVEDESFMTADGGCKDLRTGLVWSLQAPGAWDWPHAEQYGEDLFEGGFDDWRMPTLAELETAFGNGAPTHFDYSRPYDSLFWSSEHRGSRWAWATSLMFDGRTERRVQGEGRHAAFVRDSGGAGTLTVDTIDPISMPAGTSIPGTISGTGFAEGASVTFENGQGAKPTATDIVVVSGTTITATITVGTGGPPRPRVWDVRVTNSDSSTGVLVDGFTVVP